MRYFRILPNMSARWHGWRDRIANIPDENAEPMKLVDKFRRHDGSEFVEKIECATPYEGRVCHLANMIIDKIHQRWSAKDGKLLAREQNLEKKIKRAEISMQDAQDRYKQMRDEVEGDPASHKLPKWVYILLVGVLGVAEFAMNKEVFTVFGAPEYETLLMALVLSFSFPVAGHYLGRVLRERPIRFALIIVTGFFLLIVFFATYYMSRLRGVFLTLASEMGGPELVHYSWLFFLFLNLLVLAVSTYASYYLHEEDEKMYRRRMALRKSEKLFEREKKAYNELADKLAEVKGQRQEIARHYYQEAEAVADRGQELIQIYRGVNCRGKNGRRPKVFDTNPDIVVPPFVPPHLILPDSVRSDASPQTGGEVQDAQ